MAGYSVGIASETKAFKQGIESGIIEPIEDAQKELVELGKSKGPDQLEKSMKDAERATEKLGDETKRTARTIEQEFRDTYRKVKQSSDDGIDGAKKGLGELKEEANQTARESAASFDGSAESIADMFQEVAANAFAGFGPAGAIAGLAAAAGIGLAVSGFDNVNQASEESRQRASEWAEAFVEAGSTILSSATTTALAISIATDPDKFAQAQENAKNWGVDVSVAINAMAGESWALIAANDALSTSEKRIADEMAEVGMQFDWTKKSMTELGLENRAGREAMNLLNDEMAMGAEQADALSRSLANTAQNTEGATTVVDAFGDAVTTLPDGTTIYIDAETGQATIDVDLIEKKVYGIQDKDVNVNVRTSTSDADTDLQRLVNKWNGREVRLRGKVVSMGDEWG